MKRTVKTPFDFYHDGINPTHYPAGEQELPKDALAVAESEGWLEDENQKPAPAAECYAAEHRGGGKWDVYGPDEIVAADLNKEEAKSMVDELNAKGNEAE